MKNTTSGIYKFAKNIGQYHLPINPINIAKGKTLYHVVLDIVFATYIQRT